MGIKLWSWPEGSARFAGLQVGRTTVGVLLRHTPPGRHVRPAPRVVLLHGVRPYRPRHASTGLGWPGEDDDFGFTGVTPGA